MPTLPKRACIGGCPNDGRTCPAHSHTFERARDQVRQREQEFRKWYTRLPWRSRDGKFGLRADTLRKHPVCNICHRVASTIADHIKPHKGVWALFIDPNNLQGICKGCHDIKTGNEQNG